jgi:beta-1,4-mannosyltransferase
MKAFSKGYTFDWIEGEMYEKSPFTIEDYLHQRKRWLQGILLVVHSKVIPFKYKVFLALSVYSWCTMPISSMGIILGIMYPLPCPYIVDLTCAFLGGVSIYMYIYGVMKSFTLYRCGVVKTSIYIIGALCTIPLSLVLMNIAAVWGLLTNKRKFYVVQKEVAIETQPLLTV